MEVSRETLPLTAEGNIPLLDQAGGLREEHGWDCLVYLTDLPRVHDGDPLLCEVSAAGAAALVSLPGLGADHFSRKACRLLTGMVLSNRPGRLLPALASCVAAAAATGAFGIFYASIWNMSDVLSPARPVMISVVVTAALSGWLILHNGLWNRSGDDDEPWRVLARRVTGHPRGRPGLELRQRRGHPRGHLQPPGAPAPPARRRLRRLTRRGGLTR